MKRKENAYTRSIAITGGIGCGKSAVGAILRDAGEIVLDADQIARRVTQSPECLQAIQAAFGAHFVQDGQLQRAALREYIFSDKERRERLNAITHPLIQQELLRLMSSHHRVFVEIPLLFETGWQSMFQRVWLVTADRDIRLARIVARDNIALQLAEKMIDSQMPESEKIALADVVIYNNGDRESLKMQTEEWLQSLKKPS